MKRPEVDFWSWLTISEREGGMELVIVFTAITVLPVALLVFVAR